MGVSGHFNDTSQRFWAFSGAFHGVSGRFLCIWKRSMAYQGVSEACKGIPGSSNTSLGHFRALGRLKGCFRGVSDTLGDFMKGFGVFQGVWRALQESCRGCQAHLKGPRFRVDKGVVKAYGNSKRHNKFWKRFSGQKRFKGFHEDFWKFQVVSGLLFHEFGVPSDFRASVPSKCFGAVIVLPDSGVI